jgi:hypothetical protein
MTTPQVTVILEKSIQLMTRGYTCAEAALQVLIEEAGLGITPCQWAAAGYMGAIKSGKTICGCLFGGTVFLGYLQGINRDPMPEIENEQRSHVIASVENLFRGFIEQFGDTDCFTLTGCDWGNRRDVVRYFKEEVYTKTCYRFMQYVLGYCMNLVTSHEA